MNAGLGKLDRKRLSEVLRGTKGTIVVEEASSILNLSKTQTAKLLSRWAKNGWLTRVKRGLYVPVGIESLTSDTVLEEPWVVAARLANPSYIGGWSAAEYWGLTEQIFQTVLVITTQKLNLRKLVILGTPFQFVKVSERVVFGTQPVWKGQVRIDVSDPSRTILDMLNNPELGGGIRPAVDVFSNYMKSDDKDIKQLISYCLRLRNGAVFKRLGFLTERLFPDQFEIIKICKANITNGNAALDPNLERNQLITRWRLWIPEGWR